MAKNKAVAVSDEVTLISEAQQLAKRLTNERVYMGLPALDKERMIKICTVFSENLEGLKKDPEGNNGEIFSVLLGLQAIDKELQDIAWFFSHNSTRIAELRANPVVAGDKQMVILVDKADRRMKEMLKKGYNPAMAEIVGNDLREIADAAERIGCLGAVRRK